MKLKGALLLATVAIATAVCGLFTPQQAAASVDFVNKWPAKPTIISEGTGASSAGGVFTPGKGTNRLMVVAVAADTTAVPTGVSVTYGGQAFGTAVASNTATANKIWLFAIKETAIAAATSKSLNVSLTGAGTVNSIYATVAVFNGVDQTNSFATANYIASAGASPLSVTLPLTAHAGLAGNNGMAVYAASWKKAKSTIISGYTQFRNYSGKASMSNVVAGYKTTTGTANETITSTAAGAAGAIVVINVNPALRLSTIAAGACAECHGNPPVDGIARRNLPFGAFSGSHEKHSGGDNGQYNFVCTVCHRDNTTADVKHADGFKHISGSKLPRNAYSSGNKIADTNSPVLGTCNNTTCHSTGRTNLQYATSPKWGGTATCQSCHGGRDKTTGLPAKSANGFTMSTTHSQHLKYPFANVNCNHCHGKTAANHTALKDYTGALRHADGTKNVLFTNIAYGSYTSYKATASGSIANTKNCTNTACHGGNTRGAWQNNGAGSINNDNTCAHCHGTAGTTTANTDRRLYAPGFRKTGTSTDQKTSSNDIRVGSHFKHLSSAYMRNIKCNECHKVPSTPFSADTNHTLNNLRFNSGTLDFSQASTARIAIGVSSSSTPSQLAAFNGYTNGTASKAATCSSVYCHGNRLKNGVAGGTYTKPYWNYSAMINYTDPANACSRCHGNPPTSVSASHNGVTPTTGCSGCHGSVVNASGQIINKTLHINGRVEGGGHAWPYPGSIHGPLAGAASYTGCTNCHTNWNAAANTYPFTRNDALQITCKTCHKGTTFNTASQGCTDCHGDATGRPSNNTAIGNVFPNISGSHGKHVVDKGFACTVCHFTYGNGSPNHGSSGGQLSQQTIAFVHVTSSTKQFGDFTYTKKDHTTAGKGSCANNACHGLAEWGVDKLDCISCHSNPMTIANGPLTGQTRAAVAASLKSSGTRNHKSSAIGSDASKWDCIVCHMEGDTATGATNSAIGSVPGKSIHGDGVIDFRDPDTGAQVKKVAWITGAAALGNATGKYIDTLTNFTTAHFERNLAVTLENDPQWLKIASMQKNLCLKCHDYNGASSTLAQTKAIASSALQPFGNSVTNTSTQFPVRGTIRTAAGNTTNSVMNVFSMFSTGNASYHPVMGRNNSGFARAANMKAPWNGGTASKTNNVYGYLISCFDCHAPQGAGVGSNTLLTGTVVAHGNNSTGNSATMRGPSARNQATVAAPNLCTYCHADAYATTTNNHQSTSAFTASGSMSAATMGTCGNCHTGIVDNPGARAVGAHGADLTESGLAQWPTTNARPYAFWRGANTTYWGPGSCSLAGQSGSNCTTNTYTPGGLY